MTAAHLDFIRSLPCSVPGCHRQPVQAHHVRSAATAGTGMKPIDEGNTAPLCGGIDGHHMEGHRTGWRTFERKYGIDLAALASEFVKTPPPGLL